MGAPTGRILLKTTSSLPHAPGDNQPPNDNGQKSQQADDLYPPVYTPATHNLTPQEEWLYIGDRCPFAARTQPPTHFAPILLS
jgi:hypothetical protein